MLFLVVTGAGPAGMFCAYQVAGTGKGVLLLEKMPACGQKLLVTGSGQCNLTHEGTLKDFSSKFGDHGVFLRSSLRVFSNRDMVKWFSDRGLLLVATENGKFFPESRRAADVQSVLEEACRSNGVIIRCNEAVQEVRKTGDSFSIRSEKSEYKARNFLIATGGASYPSTGSTGDGYAFARMLGHRITPVRPALVPLRVEGYPFSDLSGISFEGLTLTLFRKGKKIWEVEDDLLFTHTGLSGPGVLHLSRFVHPGDLLVVSFLPHLSSAELKQDLICRVAACGSKQVKSILLDYSLPARLVTRILDMSGIPPDLTCAHLPKRERDRLVRFVSAFPFTITGTGGWEEAMVTRGGVSLDEVNPKTMESKLVPGLFFAGEVLDIDGDTGGYNLQAAFSTAMTAARGILERNIVR